MEARAEAIGHRTGQASGATVFGSTHVEALVAELAALLADAPSPVVAALARVDDGTVASLGPLIDGLYGWGIGHPDAAEALARIRLVLRRDIDRRMEIAG